EPCVREETLHRLFDGDLPDELRRLVYEHLDRCPVCSAKVDQLIRSIEADFSAEFLPLDLPTLAPDPTPTVPAPSRQKSADFIVEAKSANSESLANREATAITRASVYKFVDQHRRVFELHTDREGRVFVVVPRHLQTSAPTSVFIDSDSYQLNQVAEEMFEIQNLGERDLLDFADGFSLYGLVRP
ncbi:MAG: hypothetical protein JWP89_2874, partial [Schlesneria sp.]|nr:hypothetical protein [Schlesneria sp.]